MKTSKFNSVVEGRKSSSQIDVDHNHLQQLHLHRCHQKSRTLRYALMIYSYYFQTQNTIEGFQSCCQVCFYLYDPRNQSRLDFQ